MNTLNLSGTQQQRVDVWQAELAELLTQPDADVKVAAHVKALEGLGLEPTTKARVLAASMIGAAGVNLTTNRADDGGREGLLQQLGGGLLDAIGLARGKTKALQRIVGDRTARAANLKHMARGPLAQTIVEHLQATNEPGVSAVSLATGGGRAAQLLLTSTGRFLTKYDADHRWTYHKPTADEVHQFGLTPDSLHEAMLELTRQIGDGRTLITTALQDFPAWRSLQKNPGPSAPLPAAKVPLTGAMLDRSAQVGQAEDARTESLATAKIAFEQLGHLFGVDPGVRHLVEHLRREHGETSDVGLEVSRGIVLTQSGFQRVEQDRSDIYRQKSLMYVDETTTFRPLTLDDVHGLRTSNDAIDDGLSKLLDLVTKFNAGDTGGLSWLVTTVGTKQDNVGP